MAKKQSEAAETTATPPAGNGESGAGYFRPIFRVYQRWRKDHPGATVVPENVKQGLSNLKSVLRKQLGAKRGPKPKGEPPAQESTPRPPRLSAARLEHLEQSIDDALALAKQIDREGLQDVIRHLRARNRVVIQKGVG